MSDAGLPVNLGEFVGRADALAALDEAACAMRPLVTIIGGAGVGKTRLLIHWAQGQVQKHTVLWCDLSEAKDATDVERRVAHALSLRIEGEGLSAYLGHALAHCAPPVLLLLDNAEQVASALQLLIPQWNRSATEARFVVTSRQALRVACETVVELLPLALDEAREMFWQHARVAHSGVQRDDPLVTDLMRRLDCLPLAIELAAGRLGVLSLSQLYERVDRLNRRFETLRTARAPQHSRHASVEQAIAWSWEMLTAEQQRVLTQCACFHQGFTLEAAEAVATADSVIDVLQTLRDRGMLRTSFGEHEVRFSHYMSIRDFALKHGPSDEAAEARHADFYARLSERLCDAHGQPASDRAEAQLASELDNILAAHKFTTGSKPTLAVPLAIAASAVLQRLGPYELEREILRHAQDDVAKLDDPVWHYRVALTAGESACWNCMYDEAWRCAEQALQLSKKAKSEAGQARARLLRMRIYRERGQLVEATQEASIAGRLTKKENDSVGQALALCGLGWCKRQLPAFADAVALLERGNHQRTLAFIFSIRGVVCYDLDRLDMALSYLEHALALVRLTRDRRLESGVVLHLAVVYLMQGRYGEASAGYSRALSLQRQTGNLRYEVMTLISSAIAAHFAGRLPEAEALLDEAHQVAERVRSPWAQSSALAHMSAVAAAQDRVKEAEVLLKRAIAAGGEVTRADFQRFLEVHAGFVDLAKARAGSNGGKYRDAAARRLQTVQDGTLELRLSARLLAHALAKDEARAASKPTLPGERGATLEIGPDYEWLCVNGAMRADLSQRQPLRRVLKALVTQHERSPGTALSDSALVAAGWPNEKLLVRAAKNRLHNAIAALRRFGMQKVLLTRSDGYLLDPRVQMSRLGFQRS